MIAYLEGEVIGVSQSSVIVNVGGIGYEVNMPSPSLGITGEGETIKLFISESISPYEGTVLYGFLSVAELELFKLFKTAIPKTGAKKSLEYLSKAAKSLPDFKDAISHKNTKILTGVFGFTQKTASKLINSLKDRISDIKISGEGKIRIVGAISENVSPVLSRVFEALLSLGFNNAQSKRAIETLHREDIDENFPVEELIKKALMVINK